MEVLLSDVQAKARVLHHGFRFTPAARAAFDESYLAKRRVYSNYDDGSFFSTPVPPEILFPDSGTVATAILKEDALLKVDHRNGQFVLQGAGWEKTVDFLKTPPFYGKKLKNGQTAEQYITKLFGHTVGIFARTSCYFARQGQACKFCSIQSNQGRPADICHRVDTESVLEAVELAVLSDPTIDDIFISGGVGSRDYDANFIEYSDLALAIKQRLTELGTPVDVTLNTYPPRDLELTERLRGSGIAVMVSLELVEPARRSFICPGKSVLFHDLGVDRLLKKLVSVAGHGRVLAFLIQGIEEDEALLAGVRHMAQLGVCAVAHVLHVDPGTWVHQQNMTVPEPERIVQMAMQVSEIYREYGLNTAVLYGGRSSLDGEASRGIR